MQKPENSRDLEIKFSNEFSDIKVNVGNGKFFHIVAKNCSEEKTWHVRNQIVSTIQVQIGTNATILR